MVSKHEAQAIKPTLILIHGSWHSPATWNKVVPLFEDLGYTCICPSLRSVGEHAATATWREDVVTIRQAVFKEVEKCHEVILVPHSYASGVTCEVLSKDLTKSARVAKGMTGGVVAMAVIAAYNLAVPKTVSDDELRARDRSQWLPWWNVAKDERTFMPDGAETIFYNDLPKGEAETLAAQLRPSNFPNIMVARERTWMELPVHYLMIEFDKAVPVMVQELLVKEVVDAGANIKVRRLQSGHSPMLSRPLDVVDFVSWAASADGG